MNEQLSAAVSMASGTNAAAAAEAKAVPVEVELYLQLLVAVLLINQGQLAEVRAHHGRPCAMGHCCHCLTYGSCHPPCFLPLTLAHAS